MIAAFTAGVLGVIYLTTSSSPHSLRAGLLAGATWLTRYQGLVLLPIGLLALVWAFSPPELISQFYTAGVGLLSSSLFVPTIAGLWWKRANRTGGVAALVGGAAVYVLAQFGVIDIGVAPVVVALLASAAAMIIGGLFGAPETAEMIAEIEALHA